MLYQNGNLVVIDVSQSVEHDHPHSLQFLRSDITNVTKFFNNRGSPVLTPQRLFEFITDPTIEKESAAKRILDDERLDKLDENQYLFLNVYIPHKLDNIENFERDDKIEKAGLEPNNPFQKLIAKTITNQESEDEDSETDSSESEDDSRTYQEKHQRHVRLRGESPNTKKQRKRAVREEKREKRAVKVPKHVKKRKEKLRQRR